MAHITFTIFISSLKSPMVPGGKVLLGAMWKAAGGLIIEQTTDKLGIIDWIM